MENEMESAKLSTCSLFVVGSSRDMRSRIGVVLVSSKGHKLNCAIRFSFKATNNVAEYEARLAGLRLAKKIQEKRLVLVSQVNGNFETRDKTTVAYLKMVMELLPAFKRVELAQIPRLENTYADFISKLARSKDSDFELLTIVPIQHLSRSSIAKVEEYSSKANLYSRQRGGTEAQNVSRQFIFQDDVLYKRGFYLLLLRCIGDEQATYVLQKVHEGICCNHVGESSLA
ncbi:uncharacterized protein LOC111400278 [Olea europaea var. sylvestris]|uniref:uncharacterized protein LOC111400278 n=1 Tax=Olea europaea var. sylvestris TaxID=158386 RepID=UPI000C1CDE7D|nr:uncharacterized protein LOC111400278 [Olea europaea var. sylvestris]